MRIGGAVLIGVIGSLLIGGCSTPAGAPTPPTMTADARTTASTGSSTSEMSPAAATSRMLLALDRAKTGTFTQKVNTDGGSFTLALITNGSYDLERQGWTAHMRYEANPPSAMGEGNNNLNYDSIVVDGKNYITFPDWPAKLRGRWLRLDSMPPPVRGPVQIGGEPFPILALRAVSGDSVKVETDGGMTISGRIGLGPAFGILGLQSGLLKAGLDPSTLKGSAAVRVVVDPQGRPTGMTLDGHDLISETTLPSGILTILPRDLVDIRFTRFGELVRVTAPPPTDLIDRSEMS